MTRRRKPADPALARAVEEAVPSRWWVVAWRYRDGRLGGITLYSTELEAVQALQRDPDKVAFEANVVVGDQVVPDGPAARLMKL